MPVNQAPVKLIGNGVMLPDKRFVVSLRRADMELEDLLVIDLGGVRAVN
jgi:hypothetical protein